jgi:hypothetical protein
MKTLVCVFMLCIPCMGQVPIGVDNQPDYGRMNAEAQQMQAFYLRQQMQQQAMMLQRQPEPLPQRVLPSQPVQPRAVPAPAASAAKGSEGLDEVAQLKAKYDALAKKANGMHSNIQAKIREYEKLYESYDRLMTLHMDARKAIEAGCTREEAIKLLSKDWRK